MKDEILDMIRKVSPDISRREAVAVFNFISECALSEFEKLKDMIYDLEVEQD